MSNLNFSGATPLTGATAHTGRSQKEHHMSTTYSIEWPCGATTTVCKVGGMWQYSTPNGVRHYTSTLSGVRQFVGNDGGVVIAIRQPKPTAKPSTNSGGGGYPVHLARLLRV